MSSVQGNRTLIHDCPSRQFPTARGGTETLPYAQSHKQSGASLSSLAANTSFARASLATRDAPIRVTANPETIPGQKSACGKSEGSIGACH
jgi:hypothetical protein